LFKFTLALKVLQKKLIWTRNTCSGIFTFIAIRL